MDDRRFNCGGFSLPLGEKAYVMGVLNVTPDSFSDGGLYTDTDIAVFHALEMHRAGADIVDIGGASTAPGSESVSPQKEIQRLSDTVDRLLVQLNIPICVDTVNAETAKVMLEKGVAIINDVSGTVNEETARAVAHYGAGWIITHGGDANDCGHRQNIIGEINDFFSYAVETAQRYGVDKTRLCLDCGIGFSKSRENDLEVLRNLACLDTHGCALLVGASRKRVLREVSALSNPEKTDAATVAAHTAAIFGGANIVRAHDVNGAVQGARVAYAIKNTREQSFVSDGKILIRDLKIFANHGVNPEEKQYGQCFVIDMDICADLRSACQSDTVDDTVNYAKVIKCVRAAMTRQSFDLIERAAYFTANAVLEQFGQVREIRILLKKPDAPVKAEVGFVGTELKIKRSGY